MSAYPGSEQETIIWHPHVEGRIMPDVQIDTVHSQGEPGGKKVVTVYWGHGEDEASGRASIEVIEEGFGGPDEVWVVALGMPFDSLSPEPADLDRIAEEVPGFVADYFASNRQVYAVKNSLGNLAAAGIAKAPEKFVRGGIGSLAAYPLVNKHIGHLPFVGKSTALTRKGAVLLRLGIQTPLQFGGHAAEILTSSIRHPSQLIQNIRDDEILGVGRRAVETIRNLEGRDARLDYAFSPALSQRYGGIVLDLMKSHDLMLVFGNDDKFVRFHQALATLVREAARRDMEPEAATELIASHVKVVSGQHAPFCSDEGREQLSHVVGHIVQGREAELPNKSSRRKLAA